jgi:large subunit ribosomal protein L24
MKQHLKLKIGDRIKIIAGDEKGKVGNIVSINRKKSLVSIDSIPNKEKFIKDKEESKENERKAVKILNFIHYSNVMAWDPQANKVSRIGYKYENNKKKRFFKKSGNFI